MHLSPAAMAIVDALPRGLPRDIVFRSPQGAKLSSMALLMVLGRLGLRDRATVHGFRSSFSTWATRRPARDLTSSRRASRIRSRTGCERVQQGRSSGRSASRCWRPGRHSRSARAPRASEHGARAVPEFTEAESAPGSSSRQPLTTPKQEIAMAENDGISAKASTKSPSTGQVEALVDGSKPKAPTLSNTDPNRSICTQDLARDRSRMTNRGPIHLRLREPWPTRRQAWLCRGANDEGGRPGQGAFGPAETNR